MTSARGVAEEAAASSSFAEASASVDAGSAAQASEKEKYDRYPSNAGRSVLPAAHETWGRLGQVAEDLLAHSAAAATWRAYRVWHTGASKETCAT